MDYYCLRHQLGIENNDKSIYNKEERKDGSFGFNFFTSELNQTSLFDLLGEKRRKRVLEIAGFCIDLARKEEEPNPTYVLHMRRSPSPPTSAASTLSSSFGGGGGGDTDNNTGGVATTLPPEPPLAPTATAASRKDEWASELQPIAAGLEAVTGVGGSVLSERCGLVVGLEDWENMLSETAASSPGQDHSLLRWIAGDMEDPSSFGLKQLLQGGNNLLEFDGNAGGLGIVDQGPGFDHIGGVSGSLMAGINPSLAFSGSGFMNNDGNNGGGGKIGSIGLTSSSGVVTNCNMQNPIYSNSGNGLPLPVSLPHGMIYQPPQHQHYDGSDEKPQILNPQSLMNQQQQATTQFYSQNPNFFLPLEQHQLHHPQPKRHNSGGVDPTSQIPKVSPFCDPGHEHLLRKHQHQQQQQQYHLGFPQGMQFLPQQKPLMQKVMVGSGDEMTAHNHNNHHQQQQQQQHQQLQQHQHALLDQLYKAAELIGSGNFSHAQGILARLNHQLSPVGKPLHRAAFYFKEALNLLILNNNNNSLNNTIPSRCPSPFDVIFKMGAYKVFSEVSPLIQFVNFTSNQALLEALDNADRIHIVDFDIGFGAQWASFMHELPVRNRGPPSLKITAFASPSTHHPVELALMRDNLAQFANEIGVAFELEVVNFDSLEQTSYSMPFFRAEGEVVAVNFPIWSASNQPAALPNLLRFVKQLSPKIVVSLDRGCDRSDLPFPQHILQALHSYINLLESLDAVNVASDAVNKIEKFLLQPKIESAVLGRLRAPDKMPLWKTLFASAGYTPVTFSNFTETQAECVAKRTPVRGFHVEKRQASLSLCWQRRELISVSAWRC
ncbi:scarecrow-like protein 6 [Humulus lupulus]|uniref:scarecrow-like protein 6 n=1 Tax=Humulus lupulus TaxID=3486 RepID=UPI002B40796C|nr:scarecrow-like protein 6 [Humulus lupulus]